MATNHGDRCCVEHMDPEALTTSIDVTLPSGQEPRGTATLPTSLVRDASRIEGVLVLPPASASPTPRVCRCLNRPDGRGDSARPRVRSRSRWVERSPGRGWACCGVARRARGRGWRGTSGASAGGGRRDGLRTGVGWRAHPARGGSRRRRSSACSTGGGGGTSGRGWWMSVCSNRPGWPAPPSSLKPAHRPRRARPLRRLRRPLRRRDADAADPRGRAGLRRGQGRPGLPGRARRTT